MILTNEELNVVCDKYRILGLMFKRIGQTIYHRTFQFFNRVYLGEQDTEEEDMEEEEDAAITIQSIVRGHLVRRKKGENSGGGWFW